MEDKKICGILTEAVTDFESGHIDHIVLGIGINYSTARTVFPDELSSIAGSLFDKARKTTGYGDSQKPEGISRNRLIAEVINQMLEINENLESRDFIKEYRSRSLVLGKEILVIPTAGLGKDRNLAEGVPATAMDIDGDGGLVVRYRDGAIQTLNSGEISIRTL
jgi:BirA family biotin operon repressor/biotin-[acetyl-CoA-carboxylase] ligase